MARSRKFVLGSLIATALAATLLIHPAPAAADAYLSYGFRAGGHHRGHHHGGHHWRPHYGVGYLWGPPVVVYREPPRTVYVVPAPTVITQPVPANPASPVYQTTDGRQCREYQRTVFIDGLPQASYGTACLQPDGVWRIVN